MKRKRIKAIIATAAGFALLGMAVFVILTWRHPQAAPSFEELVRRIVRGLKQEDTQALLALLPSAEELRAEYVDRELLPGFRNPLDVLTELPGRESKFFLDTAPWLLWDTCQSDRVTHVGSTKAWVIQRKMSADTRRQWSLLKGRCDELGYSLQNVRLTRVRCRRWPFDAHEVPWTPEHKCGPVVLYLNDGHSDFAIRFTYYGKGKGWRIDSDFFLDETTPEERRVLGKSRGDLELEGMVRTALSLMRYHRLFKLEVLRMWNYPDGGGLGADVWQYFWRRRGVTHKIKMAFDQDGRVHEVTVDGEVIEPANRPADEGLPDDENNGAEDASKRGDTPSSEANLPE